MMCQFIRIRHAVLLVLCVVLQDVRGGNLVPNSSFECGSRRWLTFIEHDDSGNTNLLDDIIIHGGTHGVRCLQLPDRAYVRSTPLWLKQGITYQFSFDGRRDGRPSPLRVAVTRMNATASMGLGSSVVLGTSWGRHSISVRPTKTDWYTIGWAHFDPEMEIYLDAVQLEAGGGTSYAPKTTVEAGLVLKAPYNILYLDDPKKVQIQWYNDGPATTSTLYYEVFNLWNERVTEGFITRSLPGNAGASDWITVPLNGWQRIVSRITDEPDSRDEISVTVIPAKAESGLSKSGMIGGHANYSRLMLSNMRAAGFTWTRSVSAAGELFLWPSIEPHENQFVWPDQAVEEYGRNGVAVMATLTTSDTSDKVSPVRTASWMTNSDGSIKVAAYSNFVFRVVQRYKHRVPAWEIWNEPSHSQGPWLSVAANYARVLASAAAAVKAADPGGVVVGFGGAVDIRWAQDVWSRLSEAEKAKVDAFSCHFYPDDNGDYRDMNTPGALGSYDRRPHAWREAFGHIRPIWNTESGTWTTGDLRTEANLWGYDTEGSFPAGEYARAEPHLRSAISTERVLKAALKSLGNGFKKYFYYGSWSWSNEMIGRTHPTMWDVGSKSFRSFGSALGVLSAFVDGNTSATPFTNSAIKGLEMYQFTMPTGSNVVALWSFDRLYRRVTVADSSLVLFDCMGNRIPINGNQFVVHRMPQYLVSNKLSPSQFRNVLSTATAVTLSDQSPPNISVDIAPCGSWGGGSALLKWSANDLRWWNDSTSKNNVRFAWRLDNNPYSAWSQRTSVRTSVPAGDHVLWVKAVDKDGNEAETRYDFVPTVSGSRPGPPSPPSNLRKIAAN